MNLTARARRLMPALLALIVAGGVLLAGCRPSQHTSGRQSQPAQTVCPLDGEPASPSVLARRPLAVMIENSPRARPQSGLDKACVVYETITEGGITRFLAIYQHASPKVIGPVRSARPHFIDLAREYDAAYVHCGQSYEALQILATDSTIHNLDQMLYDRPFWRDRSRRAPHNLYTSTAKLRALMDSMDWDGEPASKPRFPSDGQFIAPEPATQLDLNFGGAVHYKLRLVYDPALGGYKRYMDGKLHVDRETGKPLVAKNVLVQHVWSEQFASSEKGTFDVRVVGTGSGFFASGGQLERMSWAKRGKSGITTYSNQIGGPLPFQAGQTWVELVPIDGTFTYSAPPSGNP